MEATQNLIIDRAQSTGPVVEYTPVNIAVTGKTATDKKMSVLFAGASFAASAYLAGGKGKVAKCAKETIAMNGVAMIASAARKGNYKPLAEALAATMGESVIISNRSTFQALPDVYAARIQDLKGGGYVTDKKTGLQKAGARRVTLVAARDLVLNVQDLADKIGVAE